MGNLYMLKKKATAELLIDLWLDDLQDDIPRFHDEFSIEDLKIREPICSALDKIIEDAEKNTRLGCLFALIFLVVNFLFPPSFVVNGSGGIIPELIAIRKLKDIYNIFAGNDTKTALRKLENNKLQLPREIVLGSTDKVFWLSDIIDYLKEFESVVMDAQQTLKNHPEKSEEFAHTYYLLQEKNSKSDMLFQNILSAVQTLGIDTKDLPQRIEPFLAKGGYMDFSVQTYLEEWMNTYKRTHSI